MCSARPEALETKPPQSHSPPSMGGLPSSLYHPGHHPNWSGPRAQAENTPYKRTFAHHVKPTSSQVPWRFVQSAADAEACPSLLNRFSATPESLKTSSEKNSHFPQELEARGRRLRKPRAGPLRARQPPGGPLGPRRRAQPRAEAPGSPGRSGKRPFPPPSKRPNRHL